MEISEERNYQIATMLFDDYVAKEILGSVYVIDESNNFDEVELLCLAKKMNVDPNKLHHAIALSCGRISKENLPIQIEKEEELKIIRQCEKFQIKQKSIIFESYKKTLPRLVKEINHTLFNDHLTLNELKAFVKPIYIEVINEVLAPE